MKNNIIELPQAELKGALSGLGKVAGRQKYLFVVNSIRVTRDKAGLVTLQGTDRDSFATYTLSEAQEGAPVEMLVPMEELQKAVKQTSKVVAVTPAGKDAVVVRTFWRDTPMEKTIAAPPINDWPKVPSVENASPSTRRLGQL